MGQVKMDFGMVAEGGFAVLTENDIFIGAINTSISASLL